MGVENEKERVSAEVIRSGPESTVAPVLPTVNPAVERKEVPASTFHPAVYVMYVQHRRYASRYSKPVLTMGVPVHGSPSVPRPSYSISKS